ncbi:unnamed protein product [marine sediment metagenome]|uniref:Uncharacterized protein n=2 Tax=marine sediment metagenome TaxID=412755 RepID=X0ZMK3_9ZZZZ
MAEKKLYDNLYKVIKANSGPVAANDTPLTEILDLQIPRNYAARIRKVVFTDAINADQADQTSFWFRGALVLDPDDEETTLIPTFTVEHDVLCDFEHEYERFEEDTTPNGISMIHNKRTVYDFDETLDVVTVRNIRFNIACNGLAVGGDHEAQVKVVVYFTYERVSVDLYAKLLGIS